MLLTLEDPSNKVLSQGEKLVISHLGGTEKRKAYFLPVPPQGSPEGRKFTLLTSADVLRSEPTLEVLFCSLFPLHGGHTAALFSMSVENSGDEPPPGSTRLACKPAKQDFVRLPASTKQSRYPFDKTPPFSYLQYDLDLLAEFQFVVVVDRGQVPSDEFVIGEFNESSESQVLTNVTISQLLNSILHWSIPGNRPLVMDIKIPALESSLLSYHLSVRPKSTHHTRPLFQPMVRQYHSDVYESKFFVNLKDADINLHGVAPYLPPSMRLKDGKHGLSFQIWSDPTSSTPLEISLTLDIPGSFGKLWMRYRTLFAAMPLVVVALVMAKQFKMYDETGMN
jgi:GPI inositol-deacylase